MWLQTLDVQHFRNIKHSRLEFVNGLNFIIGNNASGKTSILEAAQCLATGRSFRTNKKLPIISFGNDSFIIFGELAKGLTVDRIGVMKNLRDASTLRLNGRTVDNHAEIALLFPILGITPETDDLLTAPARARQSYLAWSLFHVEPTFVSTWTSFRRSLQQRNHALRDSRWRTETAIWDRAYIDYSETLSDLRIKLLNRLIPLVQEMVARLLPEQDISFYYRRGWSKECTLEEALLRTLETDLKMGFTHSGPQRADLVVKCDGRPVTEVLSRGQQKLLLLAMRLAQAQHYALITNEPPVFYVDDLTAELDQKNATNVLKLIRAQRIQTIVTTASEMQIRAMLRDEDRVFHVEHGTVASVV